MFFEFKNLFSFTKKFKKLKEAATVIAESTQKINEEKEKLDLFEFEILREKGDEYYISFKEFLYFIDHPEFSLRDILVRFKHVGELDKSKFSYLEAYAIPMENGILLTAQQPEGKKIDKVKIVSFSKVNK